jgi:hypothetical protein
MRCYIPDDLPPSTAPNARIASEETINSLIEEAFRITGNKLNSASGENTRLSASKWTPSGTIQIWENNTAKFVPIEGIEVKARNWLTTREGFTHDNGNFTCNGTLRGSAKYSFNWDRHHFSIRSGNVGQAENNGPEISSPWILNIGGNTTQEFWGNLFRAAYHYYYKDILNLNRPPLNEGLNPQMKIAAFDEENEEKNGHHAAGKRVFGIGNQIKIWHNDFFCHNYYATLIHELAHASHWEHYRTEYNNCDDIITESWARGVQWALTRTIWKDYVPAYGRKKQGNSNDKPEWYNYTGVVQDLIDNDFSSNDGVTGYSIKEIENTLEDTKTWNEWKDNIKNKYNNGTENNLDALFDYWN